MTQSITREAPRPHVDNAPSQPSGLLGLVSHILQWIIKITTFKCVRSYQAALLIKEGEVHLESAPANAGIVAYNPWTEKCFLLDMRKMAGVIFNSQLMWTKDQMQVAITVEQCGHIFDPVKATKFLIQPPTIDHALSSFMPVYRYTLLTIVQKTIASMTLKTLLEQPDMAQSTLVQNMQMVLDGYGYKVEMINLTVQLDSRVRKFVGARALESRRNEVQLMTIDRSLDTMKRLQSSLVEASGKL